MSKTNKAKRKDFGNTSILYGSKKTIDAICIYTTIGVVSTVYIGVKVVTGIATGITTGIAAAKIAKMTSNTIDNVVNTINNEINNEI